MGGVPFSESRRPRHAGVAFRFQAMRGVEETLLLLVIPAKAGIQCLYLLESKGSGFRLPPE
jgi:hypothetical protein